MAQKLNGISFKTLNFLYILYSYNNLKGFELFDFFKTFTSDLHLNFISLYQMFSIVFEYDCFEF